MSELVAVDAAALDEVLRYLRGHADFKRNGYRSPQSYLVSPALVRHPGANGAAS